jgi:2-octaprenyl-6-methoxyphenol hydroxylase
MNATLDADVIIAGAGMAGATLALALAQGGLRPVLIDPQPFAAQLEPAFDGRAAAISFSSFRALDALGVGDGLRPHAQRIEQILVTDGRAAGAASSGPTPFFLRFDAAEIAARVHAEPLGYLVENRRTRAALAQAIEAAGLTVLAPATVAGVEVEGRRDPGRRSPPQRASGRRRRGAQLGGPAVSGHRRHRLGLSPERRGGDGQARASA